MSTTACPKCGAEQPAGDACRRCGLVYAKWQGGADEEYAGVAGELWIKCVEAWDDAARHDAFLIFCRREGSLPYAAARYRAVLKDRPGDPVASKRLAELVKVAEFAAAAEAHKDSPTGKPARSPQRSAVVLVVGAVLLLGAAVGFFFVLELVR